MDGDKKVDENAGSEEEAVAPSVHPVAPPVFTPQPWAAPLLRLDQKWMGLEVRLATAVLVAEVSVLCIWIVLRGLASEYQPGANRSGLVLRGVLGAVSLGIAAHLGLRGRVKENVRAAAVTGAVLAGFLAARLWANAGSAYFSNTLNWLQSASTLTLIGGLRALATRLTLWLALLGAAIATSQGKHINVDVVMRFLSPKLRVYVAVVGWMTASIVCAAAVWGFIDDIAIGHFNSPATKPCDTSPTKVCDTSPGEKIEHIAEEMPRDLFLVGRQLSLDLRTFPRVIAGKKYDQYMTAADWNDWLHNGGWSPRFKPDDVKVLELTDPQATKVPIISIPGSSENVPGLLVRDFDLVVPFGLLVLAIRFLIRSILALTGHVRVDPDAAHGDEDIEHAQQTLHHTKEAQS